MFDGTNSDQADRVIDDWQAGFERRAAQARELAGRMEGMTASARSQDRLVEVTVGRSGELTDLWLDEESRQQTAARTAREILATVAAARVALAEKMQEAVADTIGSESEAGKAVLKGYHLDHVQPEPGVHDVVVHGEPNGSFRPGVVGEDGGKYPHNYTNPEQIAQAVRDMFLGSRFAWSPATPAELMPIRTCRTWCLPVSRWPTRSACR